VGFSGNLTAICKGSTLNRDVDRQDRGLLCFTGGWRENADKKGSRMGCPFICRSAASVELTSALAPESASP
jgi:hypothetical protein